MSDEVREHLFVIIAVSVVGIIAAVFALMQVHANMANMDEGAFSWAVFLIPCVAMLVCSFAIMATANAIGRQLFVVVTGICLAAGVVAMVATSSWFDPSMTTPPLQNPITVIRNIAAYVVVPAVGSIAGAWVGSRIHPMTAEKRR